MEGLGRLSLGGGLGGPVLGGGGLGRLGLGMGP